ncbi:MAG: DUF3486 family protein [Parvibaculum sp.]|uniref:DUF3486 family protein n=1 Tax=Chelatococcus sp. TaxID=1953771 RepID=UPI001ED37630|nr:DUF3486 family protein [Chelatococcus sp.]MBX3506869.1 DUF3486 family protein [Parvibaculum sp.]MBX3545576.1 DUF3486 family protein [Chelatococcus sp.]
MGSAAPRGRGRLSAIDMLPEWADEAKLWAFEQLKERKLTQIEILDGFNDRLRVAAFEQGMTDPPQISSSAFNRTALRLAIVGRRLQETREIAAVLAPKLDEAGDNSVTLLVAETIKTLVHEMLVNAGELPADGDTAEMLMMTSRALKHAEEAKRISADTRVRIQAEITKKAGAAIAEAGKRQGLSKERIEQLRDDFLGLSKPEKKT